MRPKRCSTPPRTSRASCLPAWLTPRPAWSWPRGKTRTTSACPRRRTGADIASVLSPLKGELAVDGPEDVMVTIRRQLYVIRLVSPEPQIMLPVILDRDRVNLAMARREICTFHASFA